MNDVSMDSEQLNLSFIQSQQPEKEHLTVHLNLNDIPVDLVGLLVDIKQTTELRLFKWKLPFPLILPPLLREEIRCASLWDLFKAPTFDELEEAARQPDGSLKRLSAEQLRDIRQWGEFDVDSVKFPGMKHKWRLSWLLQKGTERDRKNLLRALAFALKFLIIYAKDRWDAKFFSVLHSFRGVKKGFILLADLFVGLPHNLPAGTEMKLAAERLKYVLSELDCEESSEEIVEAFVTFVQQRMAAMKTCRSARSEEKETRNVLYEFYTPMGLKIDLILRNEGLVDIVNKKLSAIMQNQIDNSWFVQFRETRFKAHEKTNSIGYSSPSTADLNLVKIVQNEVKQEYLRRLYAIVWNDTDIAGESPGLPEFLVNVAKANVMLDEINTTYNELLENSQNSVKDELKCFYPIRSKIKTWKKRQLLKAKEEFEVQHKWFKYELALELAKKENLNQFYYFLQRDLTFLRDHQPALLTEFEKVTEPARTFKFKTKIWLPKNWIITRTNGGTDVQMIIPTVLRPELDIEHSSHREISFSVQKNIVREVTTKGPFWRWRNFFHRIWAWSWNSVFTFLIIIPFCSPVGVRALVSPIPFYPNWVLSQTDGSLHPDKNSKTHSFVSRLRALWRHIHKSRAKFEATPDRGFIGKNITRHFNRFWNYVVKGFFGTVLLCIFQPPLCLFVSAVSILIGVSVSVFVFIPFCLSAPLWMPFVVVLAHLFMLLIYDFDYSYKHVWIKRRNRVMPLFEALLYRILFLAIIQPVAIFLFVFVICPVIFLCVTAFGYLRYGIRSAWDFLMFNIIIKRSGRVPAANSFVARRIAGPGLSHDFFYQIDPAQALARLEIEIQLRELEAYEKQTGKLIEKPVEEFEDYIRTVFGQFGARIAHESSLFREVVERSALITEDLRALLSERRKLLDVRMDYEERNKIKLTAGQLQYTLQKAAHLLESYYPTRIFPRLHLETEDQFWTRKELAIRDWQGFASKLFAEIFSPEFLSPLEETDSRFQLEVQHIDLKRYLDMLVSGDHADDLDTVDTNISRLPHKHNAIHIPSYTVKLFSPDCSNNRCLARPNMTETCLSAEELFVSESHRFLPHPSAIMASIYNKRHQPPLTIDNADFRRLLHNMCSNKWPLLNSDKPAAVLSDNDVSVTI